ncbi:cobalamin B12-binding domain-containing protein [Methermicoccus shengliensis]|uniref:Dimethylamine corrinoid protein 3 n=1 Tax=Methermicoccus shengliensis TaxID=660064 RepID=A0A832RZ53_9EURY|nr:corrinoid protein [Methermicoccus shengliensis]KUK04192.1 MAG: Dimethylamine corrinoid protein [Euryarchaeota archaeon 55_53]HIH70409.1 dimethylamine corrinoid protein 3 [Methermicoccus shengliensis]
MQGSKEEALKAVQDALIKIDETGVLKACDEALNSGVSPLEIIEQGLGAAMVTIGELFDKGRLYLPQVMVAADIMKKAVGKLEDKIPQDQKPEKLGTVVIGTVEGDVHDIGKGIVATMLKVNGFEVYDVGRDTPIKNFVEKAKEVNADIVGASALMTTTMVGQKEVVEQLKEAGLKCKTMIGGAAPTQRWAEKIGADVYAENATEAVEKAKQLVAK